MANGGARPGTGPKRRYYDLRLPAADGELLVRLAARHSIDVRQLLLRLSAAEAADPAALDAALADVLSMSAWDGEVL